VTNALPTHCGRKKNFEYVHSRLCYNYLSLAQGWTRWSQRPCGLRRTSSAARLLRSWVRIPLGAWMFVCCECFVLSGRGLCDGLITRPEESYRLWRVLVCDQENSNTRRLKPVTGLWKIQPQWVVTPGKQTNKDGLNNLPAKRMNSASEASKISLIVIMSITFYFTLHGTEGAL
jgi:hypothetical protein